MTESIKVQPRWEVDKTGIPQFRPTTPIDPLKPPSIIQEILDRPTFFMKHNQKLTNKSISLNRAHCNNNCDS